MGAGCTGAVVTTNVLPLACQDSPTGPSAIVCTGAAASALPSPSNSATPTRSLPAGVLPSVTASATPSASAMSVPALVHVQMRYEGVGCAAGALKSAVYTPNTCTASPPSSSYYYQCVNSTYGTQLVFNGLGCTGAPTRTNLIQGIGSCAPLLSGNRVESTFVSCQPGAFIAPAASVIVEMHKSTDTCTSLTAPTQYQVVPIGCVKDLGGSYSSFANCNSTAVYMNNYNDGLCSASA